MQRPRIYLAGPEVFFPNAQEQGAEKKRLCAEHGFEGVYPLDNVISGAEHLAPKELARRISLGNERLMRSCDLLIANCTPFRGVSMDVGTAFEIGFMRALGRPVLGYSNTPADYATRARATAERTAGIWDAESTIAQIEDFGLAENLMIAVAILDAGGEFITQQVAPDRMLSDLGRLPPLPRPRARTGDRQRFLSALALCAARLPLLSLLTMYCGAAFDAATLCVLIFVGLVAFFTTRPVVLPWLVCQDTRSPGRNAFPAFGCPAFDFTAFVLAAIACSSLQGRRQRRVHRSFR